jgi:hypothetical protein
MDRQQFPRVLKGELPDRNLTNTVNDYSFAALPSFKSAIVK